MSLSFALLSSGSKANCAVISNDLHSVMVDCGLSARETERRLLSLGICASSISAIFLTHEHSDHTKGLEVFVKKHQVPVFANAGTAAGLSGKFHVEVFETGASFEEAGFLVESFSLPHDAREPVGFNFSSGGSKLSLLSDLGLAEEHLVLVVSDANALILECNHEVMLLEQAPYPEILKDRIRSSRGHLSNCQAREFLAAVLGSGGFQNLEVLVAAHISENSNTPDHALEAIRRPWNAKSAPELVVAGVESPTKLFRVETMSENRKIA